MYQLSGRCKEGSQAVIFIGSETDTHDYLMAKFGCRARSEVSALSDSTRPATDDDDDRPVR